MGTDIGKDKAAGKLFVNDIPDSLSALVVPGASIALCA
jgi:hypothetical protein